MKKENCDYNILDQCTYDLDCCKACIGICDCYRDEFGIDDIKFGDKK